MLKLFIDGHFIIDVADKQDARNYLDANMVICPNALLRDENNNFVGYVYDCYVVRRASQNIRARG